MCVWKNENMVRMGLCPLTNLTHWLGLHIRERLLTSIICVNPGEANTFTVTVTTLFLIILTVTATCMCSTLYRLLSL